MILNSGLDRACDADASRAGGGSPIYREFASFIKYACFGTGATAPAPEQTALDSQVGDRSLDTGGFPSVITSGVDAGNEIIWAESSFTRVFEIAAPVNATEYGLAYDPTGNLSARDLFRQDPNDPNSDPVTLTLDTGDQLQLVVTLRVEAAYKFAADSFTITGAPGNDSAGTYTGNGALTPGSQETEQAIVAALSAVWPGGGNTADELMAYDEDVSSVAINQNLPSRGTDARVLLAAAAYTAGQYARDWVGTFSTASVNGDLYAFRVGYRSLNGSGYRFYLTSPTTLTKASTHELSLTFRRSIARL